ncbi:hypothetical protein KIPB_009598, partial [Kipferlia bialata]|eukprot:g9598.t1
MDGESERERERLFRETQEEVGLPTEPDQPGSTGDVAMSLARLPSSILDLPPPSALPLPVPLFPVIQGEQIGTLADAYSGCADPANPPPNVVSGLALRTGVSEAGVRVWFQHTTERERRVVSYMAGGTEGVDGEGGSVGTGGTGGVEGTAPPPPLPTLPLRRRAIFEIECCGQGCLKVIPEVRHGVLLAHIMASGPPKGLGQLKRKHPVISLLRTMFPGGSRKIYCCWRVVHILTGYDKEECIKLLRYAFGKKTPERPTEQPTTRFRKRRKILSRDVGHYSLAVSPKPTGTTMPSAQETIVPGPTSPVRVTRGALKRSAHDSTIPAMHSSGPSPKRVPPILHMQTRPSNPTRGMSTTTRPDSTPHTGATSKSLVPSVLPAPPYTGDGGTASTRPTPCAGATSSIAAPWQADGETMRLPPPPAHANATSTESSAASITVQPFNRPTVHPPAVGSTVSNPAPHVPSVTSISSPVNVASASDTSISLPASSGRELLASFDRALRAATKQASSTTSTAVPEKSVSLMVDGHALMGLIYGIIGGMIQGKEGEGEAEREGGSERESQTASTDGRDKATSGVRERPREVVVRQGAGESPKASTGERESESESESEYVNLEARSENHTSQSPSPSPSPIDTNLYEDSVHSDVAMVSRETAGECASERVEGEREREGEVESVVRVVDMGAKIPGVEEMVLVVGGGYTEEEGVGEGDSDVAMLPSDSIAPREAHPLTQTDVNVDSSDDATVEVDREAGAEGVREGEGDVEMAASGSSTHIDWGIPYDPEREGETEGHAESEKGRESGDVRDVDPRLPLIESFPGPGSKVQLLYRVDTMLGRLASLSPADQVEYRASFITEYLVHYTTGEPLLPVSTIATLTQASAHEVEAVFVSSIFCLRGYPG